MRWLNRLPFTVWVLFYVVLCYLTWNPTWFSAWHFIFGTDGPLVFKVAVAFAALIIPGLTFWRLWTKTLKKLGTLVFLAVLAIVVWVLNYVGAFDVWHPSGALWWWQLPVGLYLALGLQWPKIKRSFTGSVSVEDEDSPEL